MCRSLRSAKICKVEIAKKNECNKGANVSALYLRRNDVDLKLMNTVRRVTCKQLRYAALLDNSSRPRGAEVLMLKASMIS